MLCHRLLGDARFHRRLVEIDADLGARARAGGCGVCGATVHTARYPRKPRGMEAGLEGAFAWRESFCCSAPDCRKRLTPTSVRFLDRRVYVSVVVVLAAVMASGLNSSRSRLLCQALGVDRRTLVRWQTWWREELPQMDFFDELRAGLDRPVDVKDLPMSLFERIQGPKAEARLVALLRLLDAASHSSLMRARLARVA